jgi:hypothetical protein
MDKTHLLRERLRTDLHEIQYSATPGFYVHSIDKNMRRFCLHICPESGPWKFLRIHLGIELPETWVRCLVLFPFNLCTSTISTIPISYTCHFNFLPYSFLLIFFSLPLQKVESGILTFATPLCTTAVIATSCLEYCKQYTAPKHS